MQEVHCFVLVYPKQVNSLQPWDWVQHGVEVLKEGTDPSSGAQL